MWFSIFLRRPARTPDRILKSVCRGFRLSLILVELSSPTFGEYTRNEFLIDSGSLPTLTITLITSHRCCPRVSHHFNSSTPGR